MRFRLPSRPSREQLRAWTRRLLWVLPAAYFVWVIALVLAAPGPQMLDLDGPVHFGLDEEARRDIYTEIARYRDHWDRISTRNFPDQAWSRADDFANNVRRHILMLADRYGLHYSQLFMIYDEGVRKHWTGPEGQTMPTTWVPLQPRTQ